MCDSRKSDSKKECDELSEVVEMLYEEGFVQDLRNLDQDIAEALYRNVKYALRYVERWEGNVDFAARPRSRFFTVRYTGNRVVRGYKLRKNRVLMLTIR